MRKNGLLITVACILLLAAIMMAGCTDTGKPLVNNSTTTTMPGTPAGTPGTSAVTMVTFDMSSNGKTEPARFEELVRVRLPENPSTGYTWTYLADAGMAVDVDRFEPANAGSVMPGAGGYRVWEIKGVISGPQSFRAVYARPSEPLTGNETTYNLTLLVATTYGKLFTEKDNGKTVPMLNGAQFALMLHENQATGYVWNMSLSSGLTLLADEYFPEQPGGIVGAGGFHEWDVKATGTGNQTLYGIYKRPNETTTGNEDTFLMTIPVR
jgi:inhibitor of cysteine peptidase